MEELTDAQFGALVDRGVEWQLAGRPAHEPVWERFTPQSPERCRVCSQSRVQHG